MQVVTQGYRGIRSYSSSTDLLAMLVFFVILVVASCGSDDATTPAGNSNTIGPGGGTATDPGGAKVTIPAGALAAGTAIEVATYSSGDACPNPTGPVPDFFGGAMFGPPGLQFAIPATVTIPCNRDLTPGNQFPLFVWDDVASAWAQTDFIATVAPDGKSFSAPVTHFSIFGGFSDGSGGLFGDIDNQLCASGDPASVMGDFINAFKRDIADVGDKGIYDHQCNEVTGIDFDIGLEIEGNRVNDFVREGETADESIMFVYTSDCVSGNSAGGYIDATIVIYYECTAPEILATAAPSQVEQGGSSTVSATLKCGAAPYPGQTILFECSGDGEINTDQATTTSAGHAETTYHAPDYNGEATVTAYYDACDDDPNAQTVQASTEITVGSSWTGTMTINFSHPLPDPPLLEFADVLTIEFGFDIDEGTISGTGTGTHAILITPGAPCVQTSLVAPPHPFLVTGTATEQTLQFMVAPDGLMPLQFVLTCYWPDNLPIPVPYPPYGALEGSIITTHLNISVPRENNAFASDSGSEDWGEGLPMFYSYTVMVVEEVE